LRTAKLLNFVFFISQKKVYFTMTKITMIGAGHLASQLSLALSKAGHHICQVYSRSEASASQLSKKLNCPHTTELKNLIASDLAVIAVSDDAISQVEKHIHFAKVHTSGSKAINLLNGNKVGVFYPLQSFSKNIKVDFSNIPICIESDNKELKSVLITLAQSLSKKVYEINSLQRCHLHLAAVISCNFSNLMYTFANEICTQNKIPFELLHELIQETAQKIKHLSPQESQTGPAIRGDLTIIENHLNILAEDSEKQYLYKILTNSIKNRS